MDTPSIGVGIVDMRHRGLPCRGGCSLVFQPANDHERLALAAAIGERNVHEEVVHAYHHRVEPAQGGFTFLRPGRGFSKRT